jgi:hypothetical protein
MWWRPEDAERDMLTVKDMGFKWIKQGFAWKDIEGEKGTFDWGDSGDPLRAPDHIVDTVQRYGGLELLARVDGTPDWALERPCSLDGPPANLDDFANYLTQLATRYRGRIRAYQIWNEPNLSREWCDQAPNPAAYAQLLATAYQAIKRADPNALVISGGLAPTGSRPPEALPDDEYLTQLYEAMGGDSDGYFDFLGVHAAGFAAPPEASPDETASNPDYGSERFFAFRRVEDLRAIQERFGDGDARIAVLEMGWSSDTIHPEYEWHHVSEEVKADYLVRAYKWAAENWTPWVGPMITIFLCNADWTPADEQYHWCINRPDGTPLPAFEALKAMPKQN